MKPFCYFFGAMLVNAGLYAGQQSFTVTPATLSGWVLVGAAEAELSAQSTLTLPAHAQLARAFTGNAVSLQITTQPVIGEATEDWPVLELGAVALVFSRSGASGSLLLVVEGAAPQTLPGTFDLDAAGRCVEAITLGLARNGTTLQLLAGGQSLTIPLASPARDSFEVVASAGATTPWEFQRFIVTVQTLDPVLPAVRTDAPTRNPAGLNPPSSRPESMPPPLPPLRPVPAIVSPPASGAAGTSLAPVPSTRRSTLRVFTPQAFGESRAKAIRASLRPSPQN